MKKITIWHNPRCTKSRETLALLQNAGADISVREYLNDSPSEKEISDVLKLLGISARELMRSKEEIYRKLKLDSTEISERELITAMAKHPILIERPVVIAGSHAVLGRPPENVEKLLK